MSDTTATPTTTTRTITLTNRRPVTVREDQWPIIAQALGDSYGGSDYARRQQALSNGECDTYSLRVRQHADGRALVYGVLQAAYGAWGQLAVSESWRGGELLAAGADLAAAIRRVGESGALPGAIIRACIADLPAEHID